MEKRLFVAIFLSLLVLVAYSAVMQKTNPNLLQQQAAQGVVNSKIAANNPIAPSISGTEIKSLAVDIISESSIEPIELKNRDIKLLIDPRGAAIKESVFSGFQGGLPQIEIGLLEDWQNVVFEQKDITNGVTMSYVDKQRGYEIHKTYLLSEDKFVVDMELEFINNSSITSSVNYAFNLGSFSPEIVNKNSPEKNYIELAISSADKITRKSPFSFKANGLNQNIQWVGLRNRYFCGVVKPGQSVSQIKVVTASEGKLSYYLSATPLELLPGSSIKHSYKIYLGPQIPELIKKVGDNAENIVNYGFFDTLSQMLLGVLKLLFKVSGNWGIALLLFSVFVFLIMSPLSMKSFSSMKKIQEVQPQIEEIRTKFKDNPQKMNKEIMELYRDKKINPLGGCLFMFLQMPIFISLYQGLMRFIELKGAHFLWIKDLSEPDRLVVLKNSLPLIGKDINILPILMLAVTFMQQKMTTGRSDNSDAAKQQKMMGLFFTFFMAFIFYNMPSGLVMYWTVNSLLMVIFQMRMTRSSQKSIANAVFVENK